MKEVEEERERREGWRREGGEGGRGREVEERVRSIMENAAGSGSHC